jgi:GAF domain-containing protein
MADQTADEAGDRVATDAVWAFAELAQIDFRNHELGDVLTRVAELAKKVIPGAAEVSVTLLQGANARTAASTGVLAYAVDQRQYERGRGPCVDAAVSGDVVLITDMASDVRWPAFGAEAADAGAHSSLSVGLPVQQALTGALNIYGTRPHAFSDADVELARQFAGYAAVALANAQLYSSTAALATQMHEAMQSRAVIEQAKGILMNRHRCNPDEAFERLVRESQAANVKLRVVAQRIVDEAPSTT